MIQTSSARESLAFIEFLEQCYAVREPTEAPGPTSEAARREALSHLAGVRVVWSGKPIPNRDTLYDHVRDGG